MATLVTGVTVVAFVTKVTTVSVVTFLTIIAMVTRTCQKCHALQKFCILFSSCAVNSTTACSENWSDTVK